MASKRKVNLNDYEMTTTLGTGSFGRVRLCRNKKTGEYFAMKALKKADIIKLKQVDHVISENTILADIEHPFLVRITHPQSQLSFIGGPQGFLPGQQVPVFLTRLYCRW
jgi:serine/threonine protein kinase